MSNLRTYSELLTISSFEERFRYLKLHGSIGIETFGFDRYLNQKFYTSTEWKHLRDQIIFRDEGCDLAIRDKPIFGRIYVHHMNPLTVDDVINHSDMLFDPEYLICVSHNTHNAIHYGDERLIFEELVERKPGDTILW